MNTPRDTYAQTLREWPLHDCSGFEAPLSPDEMREWFRRWRSTRGKPVTATIAVTQRSLDAAWTSFVRRWNAEGAQRFMVTIAGREETHQRHALGELAARVCALSWDEDRPCCYVHHLEGCTGCRRFGMPRPGDAEWAQIVIEYPMIEEETRWIGLYRRSLYEARRGSLPRPEDVPAPTELTHTPQRAPGRLRGGWSGAPSCHPADQPTVPGTGDGSGYSRRSDERCDHWVSHRGQEWPPRCGEHYHRDQQEGPDRRAGTEREWTMAHRLERLEHRVDQLEHENQVLR
ncbi:hypothetical protein PHMEG_00021669 [Phytophthora megakarya]|uniref:Uncharacterized protein n=1 Tax=Phytophthora megakarya TaxID=4795 RepID=A0A225VLZ9_9STRA|nr:hypothetical protein PHMEG_00021669 [Phytophthora megakarya]